MKLGAIILCRYNSSRLPGKILKLVKGKTILNNIKTRLDRAQQVDTIIVATSEEKTDDVIAEFCEANHINIYRGSLTNVAQRFRNCAKLYNLDYAMRINGDNIFIDIDTIDFMAAKAKKDKLDFVSNVPGRTFPYGMSIEIARTTFYNKIYKEFRLEEHYEHVTKYIYDQAVPAKNYLHENDKYPELKSLQMAVDNQEDLDRAQFIAELLPNFPHSYSLPDISTALKLYKNE